MFTNYLLEMIVSHAPSYVAIVAVYESHFDGSYELGLRRVAGVSPETFFVPGTVLGTGHVTTL